MRRSPTLNVSLEVDGQDDGDADHGHDEDEDDEVSLELEVLDGVHPALSQVLLVAQREDGPNPAAEAVVHLVKVDHGGQRVRLAKDLFLLGRSGLGRVAGDVVRRKEQLGPLGIVVVFSDESQSAENGIYGNANV